MTISAPSRLPLARCSILAALATLLAATPAVAAPASTPTVVLVRSPEAQATWRAAELRTRDELRFMGLRVEEHRAAPGAIERLLDETGASAAIQLRRTQAGAQVDVWIADPPRHLQLEPLASTGNEAATLAALRTAELVHAGLSTPVPEDIPSQPTSTPPAPTTAIPPVQTTRIPTPHSPVPEDIHPPALPPEPTTSLPLTPGPLTNPSSAIPGELDLPTDVDIPAPPSTPPPPRPRHPRALHILVGALGGPGGAPPLLDLTLAARLHLTRRFALEPALTAALTPTQARFPGGAVRLGLAAAQLSLVLTPFAPPTARLTPHLAAGAGLALAWAHGTPAGPLHGTTDLAAVATLHALAGLSIRLRPRLRLRLDLGAIVLLPPIAVRIAGDEVLRLGTPLIRGALGLEWRL